MLLNKLKGLLSNQFLRNIGWLGGAELASRVFRLGSTVVLARTLSPEDYGLVAVIVTTNEFANVFTLRAGIAGKLVQAKEEDLEVLCNTAYWLNWILCGSLFLIQCLAAYPIALFYKDNQLILPILYASIVYLILPNFAIQIALIDRENRFKITALCNTIQSLLGSFLCVVFALMGMGMWSMVLPMVFTMPVWVIVTHSNQSWRPKKSFTLTRWQEIVNFGSNVLGYELLDKLRANLDYLLIGRFLGVEALGLYYFAFNAGLGISLNVINVVTWPLYPYLCAARDNFQQFKDKYFSSLKTMAFAIVPLVILQSSLAPFYVPIIYSQKWIPAIPILIIICLSALPRPFANAAAMLLQSIDKTAINLKWSLIFTTLFTISVLVGMQWDIIGVATSVLIVHAVAMPIFSIWATKSVFGKKSILSL
ncbi:MAG: lipopolysaccharide biosynthesis protein [Nostocaceae cyanobacterium]|nr:lipopolysaccharide biosynthesis protein [Nostocaceae cyanobacterium]